MKKMLIPLLALSAACTGQSELVSDGETLFKSNTCVACHSVDNRMLWGPIPMPPNPVSAEEAKILAEWILSLQ